MNTTPPNIVVAFGTPTASPVSSGVPGPLPYAGFVKYAGTWSFPRGGQVLDGNGATDTTIVYFGVPFTNMGLGPNVPASPYPYHFAIYFKNSVPTGNYPLKLVIS